MEAIISSLRATGTLKTDFNHNNRTKQKHEASDIYRLLNSRKIRALKNALGLPGQYHIWRGY